MQQKATVSLVFRLNKKNAKNECPIAIRVTKDRETRLVHIGYSVKEIYWDKKYNTIKVSHPKYSEIQQKIRKSMSEISDKIQEFNLSNNYYSVDELIVNGRIAKPMSSMAVFEYYEEFCLEMEKTGKLSTLNTYKAAFAWLKKFLDGKDISFEKLNYRLLKDLLNYIRSESIAIKDNTLYGYFKNLKAFKNKAIKEGYCNGVGNDLGKFSLSQFDTKTQPRSLSIESIRKIQELDLTIGSTLCHTRNIFIFSFYCRGINLIDIAQLTGKNFTDGVLRYKRSKTGDNFIIPMHPKALEIYNLYVKHTESKYIFPILDNSHDNREAIERRMSGYRRNVNIRLRKIKTLAEISEPITFYAARHSYASGLYLSGISASEIKELMGHETEEVTNNYLRSLTSAHLSECDAKLFDRF